MRGAFFSVEGRCEMTKILVSIMALVLTVLGATRAAAQDVDTGLYTLKDGAAKACLASAKAIPKTMDSVIDTRCSLVAFEVCMNKKSGVISQSQDAQRQCAMMKTRGGATACAQPCAEAMVLPKGGSGVVGRYANLTEGAARCYENRMKDVGGEDQERDACVVNSALQCLMNGSSRPDVNAAILRERKASCKSYAKQYPNGTCSSCKNGEVAYDFEKMKANDPMPLR